MIQLVSVEALVLSLTGYSEFRICLCHCCGVGCSSGSDLSPDLGTSICCRCGQKNKEKKRKKVGRKKGRKEGRKEEKEREKIVFESKLKALSPFLDYELLEWSYNVSCVHNRISSTQRGTRHKIGAQEIFIERGNGYNYDRCIVRAHKH